MPAAQIVSRSNITGTRIDLGCGVSDRPPIMLAKQLRQAATDVRASQSGHVKWLLKAAVSGEMLIYRDAVRGSFATSSPVRRPGTVAAPLRN